MQAMLKEIGFSSLDEMTDTIVPKNIRLAQPLNLPEALSEQDALAKLREVLSANRPVHSLIGQGYYGALMPAVIQRNVYENPGWYTAYTPYQPEIAQGRLEMLVNFQTMISDLTACRWPTPPCWTRALPPQRPCICVSPTRARATPSLWLIPVSRRPSM